MTTSNDEATTLSKSPPHPVSAKQARLREKAEALNLVLLEPDVDLWKLREMAISEGGLVNDTIRRRAWPKLVGLTSYNDIHTAPESPPRPSKPNKQLRKGTAPDRVTNFGETPPPPGTAFTGGVFDQHDTAAVAVTAAQEGDDTSLASFEESLEPSEVVACLDSQQIDRDVTRCTWHLLTGGQRSRRRVMLNKHRKKISRILRRKQRRLGDLINITLNQGEQELPNDQRLCYYQGYHDVASIFLAALGGASTKAIQHQQEQTPSVTSSENPAANMGLELSSKVLYQVSLSHLREPMRADFMHLQTTLRMVLFPLLQRMDPELHAHLFGCGMEPFFALSWLLTWFSHDIRDTVLVKRLFDFFLVSHPLMPIYLSVAMLCHPSNRQEVLATPCEFAELHNVLQGLPKNSSMVGWKWSVGVDGYVSDDEEVGEDGETSISLDSDMASHQSGGQNSRGGPSLISGGDGNGIMRREDLILSEGHAHVVSMGIPAHVPFQELIDTAISFMGRVPPRKLLAMASRYFEPKQAESMLELYPSITFFHQPPSWALAGTAKADWVLKQRARERIGLTAKSRKDRKALAELRHKNNIGDTNSTISNGGKKEAVEKEKETKVTPEMMTRSAKLLKWPKAMVAQGFGPGEDEVARQNKRRKLYMIGGAATVAIFAIALGVAMQYRGHADSQLKQTPPQTAGRDADFQIQREEAVSYAKSAGVPPAPQRKKTAPTESKPSLDAPTTAATESCAANETISFGSDVLRVDADVGEGNESVVQSYLQKHFVRELQVVYAKLRLVSRVTMATVQDPEARAAIQRSVSSCATQVTKYVARITGNVLRLAVHEARENLGGNNLEELALL